MKTIEFIALPGAGKSTIQKLLMSQLREDNNNQWLTAKEAFYLMARKNIDTHLQIILKITPTPLALPLVGKIANRSQWQHEAQCQFLANYGKSLSFFLTSKAFQYSSPVDRAKAINVFLDLGSRHQCMLEYEWGDKNIVYGEGLVQKSLMFIPTHERSGHQNDSNNIYGYFKNIPKPDILIFIKTNIENSMQRMNARHDGLTERLKSLDRNRIHSFLSRSMEHLENTVSYLQEENEVQIITIDNNSSSPTATVESIFASLKNIHR
jgi:thymidylate kinase